MGAGRKYASGVDDTQLTLSVNGLLVSQRPLDSFGRKKQRDSKLWRFSVCVLFGHARFRLAI